MRQKVLECYKAILKATNGTFSGDELMLNAVRSTVREEFKKNKNCKEIKEIEELLKGGLEAERIIRTCIAQGKVNERGNIELRLPSELPENVVFEPVEPVKPNAKN